MNTPLSQRSHEITQSEIRAMTVACLKAKGLNLAQGVCDMGVPAPVEAGVASAIKAGHNSYTSCFGIPDFREAIADKMEHYNRIPCNPKTNVVVSAGSTGAFYSACLALLNPGDEVILFEPFYGYHVSLLASVEAVPRYVTMIAPDWTFTPESLERAITPRTRAIIVCTPGNPSGKVFTAAELDVIADFAIRHDLLILTDEIYEYFLYDGRRHISPGSIPRIADRTITLSGYSKTFSITGWRIGYVVCPERFTEAIGYMNDVVYVCAPAPLQMGVAAGIRQLPSSFYAELVEVFTLKRRLICEALTQAGLSPFVPQGSYYVLADVSRIPGRTSKERALFLLKETGVAGVPGSAFFSGPQGESLIRFCFAKTESVLAEACEKLKRV